MSLKWIGVLALVLMSAGAWLIRGGLHRQPAAAPTPAASSAASALDLSAADVVTARQLVFSRNIAVSGGLKAAHSAIVKARVAGELANLTVREGNAVAAGEVIGHIEEREYRMRLEQAQQQVTSAQAQLDIAQRTLDNNRALVNQGFISRNALDTSESNAQAARANMQAARSAADLARKSLDDTVLKAPIAGLISQRFAQSGERVAVDARVLEIVDLSRMELEAALAPQDVAEVRTGMRAHLQVDGIPDPVAATVARINPSAQTGTRAVTIYLALASHPALRQGLFATGAVEIDSQRALAVPQDCVRNDQAQPYVLILQGPRVSRRSVTLGRQGSVGRQAVVQIVQGLNEGDRVLAASAGLVPDGTTVSLVSATAAPAASASR